MGCCSEPPKLSLTSLANRNVAALTADDIVRIMRRAGFPDPQILEHGTSLRNALATTGAAKILNGDIAEAMFAVDGTLIHVVSRTRGSFAYDIQSATFHY